MLKLRIWEIPPAKILHYMPEIHPQFFELVSRRVEARAVVDDGVTFCVTNV